MSLEKQIRQFYEEFFNKGNEAAFDVFTAPDYRHNGMPSDGGGIKAAMQAWRKFGLVVDALEILEEEQRVGSQTRRRCAVLWQARYGKEENPCDPEWRVKRGMNVFFFDAEGRVLDNWHAEQVVPFAIEASRSVPS